MERMFSVETTISLLIIAVLFLTMVAYHFWYHYRRQKAALAIAHQTLIVFARENRALSRELLTGWTGQDFHSVNRKAVKTRFNAYKAKDLP